MTKPRISIIVAHSRNMVIGKANALLWRLPEDLKRFKKLTTSHPIIMGRKTYQETLPLVDRLYVTKVDLDVGRDDFFPEYSNIFTKKISEESGEFAGLKYSYLILEK